MDLSFALKFRLKKVTFSGKKCIAFKHSNWVLFHKGILVSIVVFYKSNIQLSSMKSSGSTVFFYRELNYYLQ